MNPYEQAYAGSGILWTRFPDVLRGILFAKEAAAYANLSEPSLQKSDHRKICGAVKRLSRCPEDRPQFRIDALIGGGLINLHYAINDAIAKESQVSIELINLNQSTTDVCMTAMYFALNIAVDKVSKSIMELADEISGLSERSRDSRTVVQTCMRDAYTDSFANLFNRYQTLLNASHNQLSVTRQLFFEVPLGKGATGDGYRVAEAFSRSVVDHFSVLVAKKFSPLQESEAAMESAMAEREAKLVSDLTRLSENILQIASDLRLLQSGPKLGYKQIDFPTGLSGSSFFKGKTNPIGLETVMQVAMRSLSLLAVSQIARTKRDLYLDVFRGVKFVHCCEAMRLLEHAMLIFKGELKVMRFVGEEKSGK